MTNVITRPKSLFEPAIADDVMSRDEAQRITEKVLKLSKADAMNVGLSAERQVNLRFAANQVSTAGAATNETLVITSSFGKKAGTVTTNDLSDAAIERAVRSSEALAKLAPENPEWMPPLPAQTYQPVNGWFEETANVSAEARARAAMTALGPARKAGDLEAAGFIVVGAGMNSLANSGGLFAYHRATNANYTLTVRTSDGTGSGWAGAAHNDWRQIDFNKVSDTAINKARLSRNPVAIEPGRYTVILEPQAVGDLVQLMAFAMDARSADEGRSAFVKQSGGNKIGEKIVDDRVSIISDPSDPQILAQPFDGQGLPSNRQVWVENGVLKQLFYTRFWAQKQGKAPTGFPTNVKMLGGNTTLDQMIASTPRGILITRLWYLRQVDPRTILYTGLTRDGTFLIENGKIARSVRNFRFNDSPLFLLNNVEALGPSIRIAGTEGGGAIVMPSVKAREFNFTSLSEAV
jgi:predicted Zn-dependent protease